MLCGCFSAPWALWSRRPTEIWKTRDKPQETTGLGTCEWMYIQVWAQAGPKGTRKLPELLAQIPIVLTPVKLPPVSQPTPTASSEVLCVHYANEDKVQACLQVVFSQHAGISWEWTTVAILPHSGVALKDSGHKKPLQCSELEMDIPFLSAKLWEKSLWTYKMPSSSSEYSIQHHFWTGNYWFCIK